MRATQKINKTGKKNVMEMSFLFASAISCIALVYYCSAKGLLLMAGETIQCTDRLGSLMANKVQATRTLALPPDKKVHVGSQINSDSSGLTELIESLMDGDPKYHGDGHPRHTQSKTGGDC